ncbi:MAG: hypothetical protein L6R38_002716 [Xanthoria sp. 2 TBL-2021]|nr:MAG: hypothetical protein L6R38_002716 [Xanthoria sp. 2 TBL-2021]
MSEAEYFVPSAVVARIGGSGQGKATMMTPAGGFAELGLARIFGSDFVSPPSAAFQSESAASATTEQPSATRRAIIAGTVVGGSVLLGLSIAAAWFFRGALQQILIGDIAARLEMDGKGKTMAELPAKGVFWELPVNSPVELWTPTPTISPTSGAEVEVFKHETSSDRELGWRGEIECEGDVEKRVYVRDEKDRDDAVSNHITSTCKELD